MGDFLSGSEAEAVKEWKLSTNAKLSMLKWKARASHSLETMDPLLKLRLKLKLDTMPVEERKATVDELVTALKAEVGELSEALSNKTAELDLAKELYA